MLALPFSFLLWNQCIYTQTDSIKLVRFFGCSKESAGSPKMQKSILYCPVFILICQPGGVLFKLWIRVAISRFWVPKSSWDHNIDIHELGEWDFGFGWQSQRPRRKDSPTPSLILMPVETEHSCDSPFVVLLCLAFKRVPLRSTASQTWSSRLGMAQPDGLTLRGLSSHELQLFAGREALCQLQDYSILSCHVKRQLQCSTLPWSTATHPHGKETFSSRI